MAGPTRTYGPNDLLTSGDVASLLNCSERWVRKLRAQGKGPVYFKLSNAVRYRYDMVMQWLAEQRRLPAPPPPPNRSAH